MLVVDFTNFPVLESERIVFRRVLDADFEAILILRGNPETMKYIPRPLCGSKADALQLITVFDEKINTNQGINWGMVCKETNELFGLISFHVIEKENFRAEIGYMILPNFEKKGLVTEGVKTLLHYGFNRLKLNSVCAIINPENLASEKLLKRNGFTKEAHFRKNFFLNGIFLDSVIYGILRDEFLGN
jgi:[ribosomal protein S5]-alanine N-acetyltransferase